VGSFGNSGFCPLSFFEPKIVNLITGTATSAAAAALAAIINTGLLFLAQLPNPFALLFEKSLLTVSPLLPQRFASFLSQFCLYLSCYSLPKFCHLKLMHTPVQTPIFSSQIY